MEKKFTKTIEFEGRNKTMIVEARFDDRCKNGHSTFSITGQIGAGNNPDVCGCIHDEIAIHFPELKKYIKWHLTSTEGPLHYVANTVYWTKKGNLQNARSCAVWEDATLEQLSDVVALHGRLPSLMEEFDVDMKELFV